MIQPSIYVMLHKRVSVKDMQRQFDAYPFDFVTQGQSDYRDKVLITKLKGAIILESSTIFVLAGLFVVGLLVLLVALFNYISFQTAKFYNRLHECAIRKVNGAGKWHQWFLFSVEVVVVFVAACGIGFLLLEIIVPIISRSESALALEKFTLDALRMQLLKYVVYGLALALLLCIFPSRAVNRLSTKKVLLGLSEKGKRQSLRTVLMFIQMIILLTFLSATVIIQIQMNKVKSHIFTCMTIEEQKHTLTVPFVYKSLTDNQEVISARLKISAAIEDICWAEYPLTTYGSLSNYDTGLPGHENEHIRMYKVSPGFSEFFHAKMKSGIFINEYSHPSDVVVDETFAALYPDGNPVGKSFDNYTIIGVIENIQMVKESDEITQSKRPVFYSRMQIDKNGATLYVKAVPGRKKDAQQSLMLCLREFAPESLDLRISDFQEEIGRIFELERTLSLFAMLFTIISVVLSLLSIYSAVAMNTEKRRKEVAIRKINGAQVFDIIRLFSKMYVILWTVACGMVFPVVYLVAKQWVNKFNQAMSLNIGLFLLIYFAVLTLIMLTILYQILNVARTNPAEVMKS
jgi:ABC-type antimicrobial peptide transport system permease subunit